MVNTLKTVPIDPIQWKSESARIKTLLQERESLKLLPEKLEDQITEISKLCNCESDSSRIKIATMGVLLDSLPEALEERRNFLENVEKNHSDFNSLIDGLTTSYLSQGSHNVFLYKSFRIILSANLQHLELQRPSNSHLFGLLSICNMSETTVLRGS